jgi:hypothetical protein
MGGLLLVAGSILYYLKNRLVPLNNSVFLNEIKTMFEKHPKIRKAGRHNWSNIIKGGRRGSDVDLEIDVTGQLKGHINVSGKYNEKLDEYKINKAEFVGIDQYKK